MILIHPSGLALAAHVSKHIRHRHFSRLITTTPQSPQSPKQLCHGTLRTCSPFPTIFPRSSYSFTESTPQNDNDNTTHFGFETVSEEEKTKKVHSVFQQVASTYDTMNDVMSLGIHRCWKDRFVRTLSPYPGIKILDVAGGTGDIAFRLVKALDVQLERREPFATSEASVEMNEVGLPLKRSSTTGGTPKADVTVFDLSESMLQVGKQRAEQAGLGTRIDWVHGNAEELPFADGSFDAYTIAFGIRNVTHIERALDEAFRVLKRGGRILLLEFSQVRNPVLAWFYEKYSFQVIPAMGQLIASDWKSYQYLVESIRMFPDQEEFRLMIEDSGFKMVTYENLSQGICAIHSGFKF